MRPSTWAKALGAGAGLGLGAWIVGRARTARAAALQPSTDTSGGGTPSLVNVQWGPDAEGYTWDYLATDMAIEGVAERTGFRRMVQAEVTQAHTDQAKQILREHHDDAIGTAVPFDVGGRAHLGVIERHYHEPGGKLHRAKR